MTAVSRRSFLLTGGTAAAAAGAVALLPPAARAATAAKSSPVLAGTAPVGAICVAAGQTYTVPATTRVSAVTIEAGGVLAAPAGHSLTMTVNGVETGQKLVATTQATHFVDTITSANWWQLGAVSNAPQAAVNNGVIVSLAGHSTWAVTGPSYLTALSLDATSAVTGPRGGKVTMTVNGTPTTITPGASYTGAIVVTPAEPYPA